MRPDAHTNLARELRGHMTDAETRLWFHLRRRRLGGWRFRRQFPVGPYIADFACIEAALIVEVDGSQHLEFPADARRDAFLARRGFRVHRFWNDEVLLRTTDVLAEILRVLEEQDQDQERPPSVPSGQLPPQAGEATAVSSPAQRRKPAVPSPAQRGKVPKADGGSS